MSIETKWDADTERLLWLEETERLRLAKGSITNLLGWCFMPIRWIWHRCFDMEAARTAIRIGWEEYTGQRYTDAMKQR